MWTQERNELENLAGIKMVRLSKYLSILASQAGGVFTFQEIYPTH